MVDSERSYGIEEVDLLSSFSQYLQRLLLYSIATKLCIAQSRQNTSHGIVCSGRTEQVGEVEGGSWGPGMGKDLVAFFQAVFPCPLGLQVGMVLRF